MTFKRETTCYGKVTNLESTYRKSIGNLKCFWQYHAKVFFFHFYLPKTEGKLNISNLYIISVSSALFPLVILVFILTKQYYFSEMFSSCEIIMEN